MTTFGFCDGVRDFLSFLVFNLPLKEGSKSTFDKLRNKIEKKTENLSNFFLFSNAPICKLLIEGEHLKN